MLFIFSLLKTKITLLQKLRVLERVAFTLLHLELLLRYSSYVQYYSMFTCKDAASSFDETHFMCVFLVLELSADQMSSQGYDRMDKG